MNRAVIIAIFILCISPRSGSSAEPDATRGRELFGRACAACHSLAPDKNMTGPSLAGLWGRKAGSLKSFPRYSEALKSAGAIWDDAILDSWLKDPKAVIPGNRMVFSGVEDDPARADLLAFLKGATRPDGVQTGMTGTMGMGGDVPSLKAVPPGSQVKGITYCGDTYSVATADGQTTQFWERNLRFKTDSGGDGPPAGIPAMVGAGMVGDRASVIFASPEEFGRFITSTCR